MFAVGTCPRKSSGSAHHSVPLLGEQVGVKEREQGRVRDRDTQRERTREGNRGRDRVQSRRRCGASRQLLALMTDMSLKRRCVPCSDTGHILCLSSVVVIQTTSPPQAGHPSEMAPRHSRWNKAHHMAKHHLHEFPSKRKETK